MSTWRFGVGASRVAPAVALAIPAGLVSIGLGTAAAFVPTEMLNDFVALALMLAGLLAARILYGTIASPLGLFAIAWEGGLLLANLHLASCRD